MKTCLNCGNEFEGNFCPNCGTKWEEIKCPKCENITLHNAKYCHNCGSELAVNSEPAKSKRNIPLLITASALLAAILIALIIVICTHLPSIDGIYYKVLPNETTDSKTYFELKSGKWTDEDGETGTYKTEGNNITFYIEFFGEQEEVAKGTIEDNILTINQGGYEQKYQKK